MKNSTAPNLWQGNLPKIGIRPTIDGRLGGVRESLETQTMNMAERVADLISANMRYPNGNPVAVRDRRHTASAGSRKPPALTNVPRENVGVSLTVTPCWCYGSETMDMDPLRAQGCLGIQRNGASRRGVSGRRAGRPHPERPAGFRYLRPRRPGRRMTPRARGCEGEDSPLCPRAAWPWPLMRGKAYLSIGRYLDGHRRFDRGSRASFRTTSACESRCRHERSSPAGCKGHLRPGRVRKGTGLGQGRTARKARTTTSTGRQHSSASRRTAEWEDIVKMTMIARDLMVGNPELAEMGFGEEAHGHNAIASGFQGQRQWTDHFPNGDFLEAILNIILRLERHPRRPTSWPPRTTHSTASPCCSATC